MAPSHHLRAALYCVVGLLLGLPRGAHATDRNSPPGVEEYRVGDRWDKTVVTRDALFAEGEVFARAAQGVARYGDRGYGTAFYLGRLGGVDLMATNHHVQPTLHCENAAATFPFAHATFDCERVFVSWPEVDLALFAITIPEAHRAYFDDLGQVFAFDASIRHGQELMTFGYGAAGNPRQSLTVDRDPDCVVFSDDDAFRLMADPDDFNPGPYRAWSFAHGCDISHGDSGSPMLDRATGAVLGILWTGAIPKDTLVQSSSNLQRLLRHPTDEVWTKLGYAVPSHAIKERIEAALAADTTTASTRRVLRALLNAAR